MTQPATDQEATAVRGAGRRLSLSVRVELVVAVVLSVAALMTAWSAYQSAKWGSVMSASYGLAGAARTEGSRASTLAGQQTIIDVQLFTDWLQALDDERPEGQAQVLATDYVPEPASYSGFLYARFRPEFRPAVHAWLAEDPTTNADAPPSPFAMEEYVLAARTEGLELDRKADAAAARALGAADRKDSYVLVTVMCSSVLFLGGVGSKLSSSRARGLMLGLAVAVLVATGAVLASFPVEV
jgi:hypothetical protein